MCREICPEHQKKCEYDAHPTIDTSDSFGRTIRRQLRHAHQRDNTLLDWHEWKTDR